MYDHFLQKTLMVSEEQKEKAILACNDHFKMVTSSHQNQNNVFI